MIVSLLCLTDLSAHEELLSKHQSHPALLRSDVPTRPIRCWCSEMLRLSWCPPAQMCYLLFCSRVNDVPAGYSLWSLWWADQPRLSVTEKNHLESSVLLLSVSDVKSPGGAFCLHHHQQPSRFSSHHEHCKRRSEDAQMRFQKWAEVKVTLFWVFCPPLDEFQVMFLHHSTSLLMKSRFWAGRSGLKDKPLPTPDSGTPHRLTWCH